MAEVLCDTSSMQYLHQLGLLHLLPQLAERVLVPQAVVEELAVGRALGFNVPDPTTLAWVEILSPSSKVVLPLVTGLGQGETAVLALGLEMPGTVVVLDDRLARRTAEALGIPLTGTIGVLIDAKRQSLVPEVAPLLDQLQQLGFHLSARMREAALKVAGETSSP